MKTIKDFSSYEEAIEYSYVDERMVSADMVVSLLTRSDSVLPLMTLAKTDNKAAGFLLALTGSVSDYNVKNSSYVGQQQQLLLDYLISKGGVTQEFKDAIVAYANPVVTPYSELSLEDYAKQQDEVSEIITTSSSKLRLTHTEDATTSLRVVVYHRFGNEGDLTEWHELTQFSNVRYHQNTHETSLPTLKNFTEREIKVVSPEQIGMTITVVN